MGSRRTKILVVDDDPIVLEVVRERLSQAGFDVHVREEAIGTSQWISTHSPDFLLLDLCMPAISGNDLAQILRRHSATSGVSVILHSSMSKDEVAPIVRSTGAIGAVTKGGDPREFIAEINRLVTARLAEKKLRS